MRRLWSLEAERWLFWKFSTLYGSTLLEPWRFQRCGQQQISCLVNLRYKTSWKRYGMPIWTDLQATWTRLGVLGGVFQVSWRRLAASWSLLRASWRRLWWSSSRLRHVLKFFTDFSSEFEAPWRRPGGFLELPWTLFSESGKRFGRDITLSVYFEEVRS